MVVVIPARRERYEWSNKTNLGYNKSRPVRLSFTSEIYIFPATKSNVTMSLYTIEELCRTIEDPPHVTLIVYKSGGTDYSPVWPNTDVTTAGALFVVLSSTSTLRRWFAIRRLCYWLCCAYTYRFTNAFYDIISFASSYGIHRNWFIFERTIGVGTTQIVRGSREVSIAQCVSTTMGDLQWCNETVYVTVVNLLLMYTEKRNSDNLRTPHFILLEFCVSECVHLNFYFSTCV